VGDPRHVMGVAVFDVPAADGGSDRVAAIADVDAASAAVFLEEALTDTALVAGRRDLWNVRPREEAKAILVQPIVDRRDVLDDRVGKRGPCRGVQRTLERPAAKATSSTFHKSDAPDVRDWLAHSC